MALGIRNTDPPIKKKLFWENWLKEAEANLKEAKRKKNLADDASLFDAEDKDKFGYMQESLYKVMKLAIEHEQYIMPYTTEEEVTRVCKVYLPLSRESVKKIFNRDTFGIYGVGVYTLFTGIMIPESVKRQTGWGTTGAGAYFNINFLPEKAQKDYDWRLAVPAMGGLFIPKKEDFNNWLYSYQNLEYLDIMDLS